jgi:hypothetical protein
LWLSARWNKAVYATIEFHAIAIDPIVIDPIVIDPIVIGFASQNLMVGGPGKHAEPYLFLFAGDAGLVCAGCVRLEYGLCYGCLPQGPAGPASTLNQKSFAASLRSDRQKILSVSPRLLKGF